ncbi:MAG: TetR/AcrR family transcriptional regulator [Clostridia bacterium]|nr:TetR/AcrR family transcriptional regulator [Clostridia bacterium]
MDSESREYPGGKKRIIIEAAAKVFSKKGFHKAKIEEIAKEAGIGKGTIYEYFTSKEELFKEMLSSISREYIRVLDFSSHPSAVEQIKEILKQHFNFMGMNKDLARLIIANQNALNGEIRQWFLEQTLEKIYVIEGVLEKGRAAGEFKEDLNVYIAARIIFGSVMALSGAIVHENLSYEGEALVQDLMDLLLNGFNKNNGSVQCG